MTMSQQALLPFAPLPPAMPDVQLQALSEAYIALQQAESVIRQQEERIRQLEAAAVTDELTGILNRRGFTQAFSRELVLARRDADRGGVLVMIDLDGFKAINDTWGHQAGDAYLQAVADILHESVRASDIVARLGGDEFAVLFTGMSEQDAAKRVAKLERVLTRQALSWNGKKIPLRASFGFASYTGTYEAAVVMQSADVRLYAQKARTKMALTARCR